MVRHGEVPAANCGVAASKCWLYVASLQDTSGTFSTITSGHTISGVIDGTFSGGSTVEFYADNDTPSGALDPASVDVHTQPYVGTTDWVEQFFPAHTDFGAPKLLDWSWTYMATAPHTCETWTDALSNGDGQQASDGNITGVNHCV